MCERTYCRHEHEKLCSCPPVACRDALGMAAHLAENMEKVQWSLTYNSLKEIKPYQLCLVGKCRICGGRLCMEQRPVEADSTDGFLAAVYRHLYHFHRSIGQCLPRAAFRTKFVEMFRKEDRAAVEDWLSMPENQSIHAMISLKEIKPYQLCLVGKCRICGGRLCMEQRPVEADSTDGFLAAVYRHLYHFHRSIGQCLPRAAFRTKFVEMFRKEDRAAVEDWLSMPENQSIHAMICGNAKRVYTIVHSWADADQGNFPAPEGMAAFTVKEEARKELARLVTEEKENRTIPFPTEEYCEEYGEDFWEAYRDGYAAGWFTRYEIIESPLYAENIEEKGGAADDAAKTELL